MFDITPDDSNLLKDNEKTWIPQEAFSLLKVEFVYKPLYNSFSEYGKWNAYI